MYADTMPVTSRPGGAASWRADLALGLIAALVFFAIQAAQGFPALSRLAGDNDSLLRLVEIRDLINGQNWFDLHQYRMGPQGGFIMHWSRVVDAPVAGIMLVATALGGSSAAGEITAQVVWPALMMVGSLFALLRLARLHAGGEAVLPALVVGAITLDNLAIFKPGALDHHNIQLMLCLMVLWLLASGGARRAAAAGVCSALMLAIGMETAPYIAVAGLCVAGIMLTRGAAGCRDAIGFGLGFAVAATLLFFGTVPHSVWSTVQCDAYSVGQFGIAALAGFGITLAAAVTINRGTTARLASLAALGAAIGSVILIFAPQCLANPYSDLDPRLVSLWLDYITEAQPLWRLPYSDASLIALRYVTPFIAIGLVAAGLLKGTVRRVDLIVAAFLLMAILVSLWQVRGSTFSIAIAVVPLAGWIARWRVGAVAGPGWASAGMVLAWLLSINLLWGLAYVAVSKRPVNTPAGMTANVAGSDTKCEQAASYAALAEQPVGAVLAISNLGSPILAYTPHRVLYAPYHRNKTGNLDALKSLIGTDSEAESTVRRYGVTLVALCPGNTESGILRKAAPGGLLAELSAGKIPNWLEPIAATASQPLQLFRVR